MMFDEATVKPLLDAIDDAQWDIDNDGETRGATNLFRELVSVSHPDAKAAVIGKSSDHPNSETVLMGVIDGGGNIIESFGYPDDDLVEGHQVRWYFDYGHQLSGIDSLVHGQPFAYRPCHRRPNMFGSWVAGRQRVIL